MNDADTASADALARSNPTGIVDATDETKAAPNLALNKAATEKERSAFANPDLVEEYFGPLPTYDVDNTPEHVPVRGIYIASGGASIDSLIELCSGTEINAVVLDLKESDFITYDSQVPLAKEVGRTGQLDVEYIVDRFHENNIRVIGRIVCFKDPCLAELHPEMSIRDIDGNQLTFTLEHSQPFASPYNKDVWEYNIAIAREAIELGFDEIQFDYIRFPSGSSDSGAEPYFGPEGEVPEKWEAINRFLQTAQIEIEKKLGVPIGADTFPIIMTSALDGEIVGQNWDTIGLTGIDNVCPMIYPSHYANKGHNGLGSHIGNNLYPALITSHMVSLRMRC